MTIAFRPMIPADREFVRSGWSSSYRTSYAAGLISMDTWADVMHREINAILDRPSTAVTVAHEPGETDHVGRPFLYGFIAALKRPDPYVLYAYVKAPYRRQRIAARLFAAAGVDPKRPFGYACRTGYCDQLAAKIPAASFNPLPARYQETR